MLLYYLSLAAVLVAFAFVVLSLASGLLYISELIEEHSRLAKIIGQRAIYVIIALHGLLYVFDGLPLWHTLFSAACHAIYLQNFSPSWPMISLTSWTFLASAVLVIADHFLWFFYFARLTAAARHHRAHYRYNAPTVPGFAEIATFFGVCVWLVPLFLFLSLSANDNALPVASGTDAPTTPVATTKGRVSLFRSMFSVPGFRPSRRESEGIIAPRPPSSPHPDGLLRSPSLNDLRSRQDQYFPPPPRSPGGSRVGSPELRSTPTFELGQPPKSRSYQGLRGEGDSGLAFRRTSSFHDSNDSSSPAL